MIKEEDIVILKDIDDINFKYSDERSLYLKYIKNGDLILGDEYIVYLRLSQRYSYGNRLYYTIGVNNVKTGKRMYANMTWFREIKSHIKLKRKNKINIILND